MEENLLNYQKNITGIFGVGVQILNLARSFDELLQKMELHAINGVIQANKISGVEGKPLVTLGASLSTLHRQMIPEIEGLKGGCQQLSRITTICFVAAKRYYQYTNASLLWCTQVIGEKFKEHEVKIQQNILNPQELQKIILPLLPHALHSIEKNNFSYLLKKSSINLMELRQNLEEVSEMFRSFITKIRQITMVTRTARYISGCIAVNANTLEKKSDHFKGLSENMETLVNQLDQKQREFLEHIDLGNRYLQQLDQGEIL
ncbi:MAG: hypothetical protein COB67_02945 [SAR324 cluster bacterium]|uniref:Uncharacterized protein n=1 Tax=SAR324 cluster bacterium TaxID=2024889 RepID=A0A2A4T8N4_9DELT|nr:MAG: hypothetical protein COB67_02945 [SAR324 cluster bacterium]